MNREVAYVKSLCTARGREMSDGEAIMATQRLATFLSFMTSVDEWRKELGDFTPRGPRPCRFEPEEIKEENR